MVSAYDCVSPCPKAMNLLGIGEGQQGKRRKKSLFLLPKVIKRKKKTPVTLDIMEEKRTLLNDIESLKV